MSDNPSFVLRGVEDVVYEQRPIPESTPEFFLLKSHVHVQFIIKQFRTTKSWLQ